MLSRQVAEDDIDLIPDVIIADAAGPALRGRSRADDSTANSLEDVESTLPPALTSDSQPNHEHE